MTNDPNRQKEFIEELLKIQQERKNQPLSKEEQQEIASQIGLSDADWQMVTQLYKAHVLRGRGFLSHQNYDDAILELLQAHALRFQAENATETAELLAKAYFERFQSQGKNTDKELAISYSQLCLEDNPSHSASLTIISDLKRKAQKNVVLSPDKPTLKWIYFVLPILLIFVIIAYFSFKNSVSIESDMSNEISTTIQVEEPKTEEPKSNIDFNASEYEIPVEINDKKLSNLEWQTESSVLNKFINSYKVELKGNFLIKNPVELNELKVKVEFLDTDGKLITTAYQEAVKKSDLALRKDDIIPFQLMIYEKQNAPTIAKIILSSSLLQEEQLMKVAKYEDSTPISVSWEQKRPQNTNLELKERESRFSDNIIGGGFHHVTLEIKNTGNSSISLLKLRFNWFDSNKKLLANDIRYAVSGSTSTLKRNQIRILSTVMAIPKVDKKELPNLTYQVEIIEIQ